MTEQPFATYAPTAAAPPQPVPALDRLPCAGCGSEAHWNAAKQALVCPYCGTVAPMTVGDDGALLEAHDAARLLRAVTDESRGWATDRTPVRCTTCEAISLFEPARVGGRCDFCGSASLLPIDHPSRPIRPEGVLPFALAEPDAREKVTAAMGAGASVLEAIGLYVPYWRLTVDVYVHWTALIDEGTKDQPDYRPADGGFSDVQNDWLMPGTKGLPEPLMAHLGDFPLDQLRPYAPEFVRGWVVEQYQVDLVAASDRVCARSVANAPARYRKQCHMEVPARHYTNLLIAATSSVQTFSHLLLPVWRVQVATPAGPMTLLVNGVTGTVAGAPARDTSLAFALAIAVAVVAAAWLLWRLL